MLNWNPEQESTTVALTVADAIGANRGDTAGDSANKREAAETEGAEEFSREERGGRQALMHLGIFLEHNTVQEDTVGALSSIGWL